MKRFPFTLLPDGRTKPGHFDPIIVAPNKVIAEIEFMKQYLWDGECVSLEGYNQTWGTNLRVVRVRSAA